MQLSRRLFRSSLIFAGLAMTAGCARDLDIEPQVDPLDFTVAQFDPTNPIPVLQLTPTPTALGENPDGTINAAAVAPEACELPTAAQCLQFANGWPTSLPLTLYFSKEPAAATLNDGIKVYEVVGSSLLEIETNKIWQDQREEIPADCVREFNIEDSDIPPGGQLIIVPAVDAIPTSSAADFKPGTRYVVAVESFIDAASGTVEGLTDQDGQRVEPSALFTLLNVPNEPATVPVLMDGTITSALLRSQVTTSVLEALGLDAESLTPEEQMTVAAAVQQSGESLYPLFRFFSGTVDTLVAAGALNDRSSAVLVNAWTTEGPPPTEISFDPGNAVFPFPNSELLTRPAETVSGVQVSLPIDDDATPTERGLITALNTLTGFSTTASISFQSTRPLDVSTLADNVVMYEVDDSDASMPMVVGDPLPLRFSTYEAGPLFTVFFRSERPLRENSRYAVAITSGLRDVDGNPVRANGTYSLLKTPAPIIDEDTVNPAVLPALQCAQFAMGADLEAPVDDLATQLEVMAARPRWAETVQILGREPANIASDDVLMGFTYHTQDVSGTVTTVRDALLPGPWQSLGNENVVGPIAPPFVGTASIAEAAQVVDTLCLGICGLGEMEPQIPVAECGMDRAALEAHPFCQLAINVVAGGLSRASLYLMKGFKATSGNPFVAGTFTPETIQQPDVVDLQVWVIEPAGTPPAEGWPVAIFQHGLGSEKETGFLIANSLAAEGFATVLMDIPFHGSRASDITTSSVTDDLGEVDILCFDANGPIIIDPADVLCDPEGNCVGGCDGVQDPSGTGFLSTNLFGTRDNFRQTTIDQLTLLQTLAQEGTANGAWPFLDGSRVGFVGQSLGSITGGSFAAYAENLLGAVLNAPGGGLTTVVVNAIPEVSASLYKGLNQAGICTYNREEDPTSGCMDTPDFRQFLISAQWALDPGDPLANAPGVVDGLGIDRLLLQVSQPDPVVSNIAARLLGQAYDFDLDPDDGGPYQVYDFSALPQSQAGSGCHSFLLAPICGACLVDILCNTLGAQQQAAIFLATEGETIANRRPDAVAGAFPCVNACN